MWDQLNQIGTKHQKSFWKQSQQKSSQSRSWQHQKTQKQYQYHQQKVYQGPNFQNKQKSYLLNSFQNRQSEKQIKIQPCKFFHMGKCIYGQKCKFLHDKEKSHPIPKIQSEPEPRHMPLYIAPIEQLECSPQFERYHKEATGFSFQQSIKTLKIIAENVINQI